MMDNEINSYLVFRIDSNEFAAHVSKVVEILEYKQPLPMPDAPSFLLGVLEHRDEMVPVVDPSRKFGLNALTITTASCIIILELTHATTKRNVKIGVVVDAVTDIIEPDGEELKSIQNDFRPDYILGTYKKDDKFYMVLNVDKVFSTNEIVEMSTIITDAKK